MFRASPGFRFEGAPCCTRLKVYQRPEMSSRSSSSMLRLPGEDARELWLREGRGVWKRAARDDGSRGGILAIEAIATDSAPFWAPASSDPNVSVSAMAALHWEALGMDTEGGGRRWMHWQVCEQDGRVLAGTMGLADDAPEQEWAAFRPEAFELGARLFPIPGAGCALWKELGRYVLAFAHGESLLHVAVLNARELNAAAAWEVRDIALSLDVRGLLPPLRTCSVWTAAGEEFLSTLKLALGVRLRVEDKPAPALPPDVCVLLPPIVARQREARLRRGRTTRRVLLAASLYVAFFSVWAGWLMFREQRVQTAFAGLQAQAPQVQAIREAQMRWSALEPATEPDRYPVETFHQLVSLLPEEGIQLKDFSLDLERLTVGGVASSVNHALKFKADLENNSELKSYTWNFPAPTILEDNRATFRAEGTLNGGGKNESE